MYGYRSNGCPIMYTNQAHNGPDGGDSHAQESELHRPIDDLVDEYLMDEWQVEKTIQYT